MDTAQLIIELETLGTVTFCDVIEGTTDYGIGLTVNSVTQATLDTFDSIITTYVLPHYPTTLDRVMDGDAIKAVYR